MKILRHLILLLAGLSVTWAQQQNKSGTAAAQFLKIGVGGRAVGMAGATAGITDDMSALYWNPSGVLSVSGIGVFAAHTDWFADIQHQFFGAVVPVSDDHRFGISATVLTMGEMEITTELEPRGTGTFFDATDVAVGITYATRPVTFFSFGATVKYVAQSIYNESASAIALDLGTLLDTDFKGIKIGMAFTNFGTRLKLEGRDLHRTYDPNPNNATNVGVSSNLATEEWEMPINFRVGIGWDLIGQAGAMMKDETHGLLLAADANHPNDAPENASIGLEYHWSDIIALRSGYHFNDDVKKWTYGLGFSWGIPGSFSFAVDYAFMDLDRLAAVHVFSIMMGF